MAMSHTVSGLLTKRAEVAGRIVEARKRLSALAQELDALDATIRLFDPSIDVGKLRAKAIQISDMTHRGEMSRLVLNALRVAHHPMTSLECARIVMEARGMDLSNRKETIKFRKRVGVCLWNLKKKGVVQDAGLLQGEYKGWELAR